MIAYLHRTYPHRRTSKQHISNLQGAETADVGNNLVYGEQHVARISLLYRLSIDIQMEIHVLNVAYFSTGTQSPMAAELSNPLHNSQGFPSARNLRCKSRAVKSMPTVTAS